MVTFCPIGIRESQRAVKVTTLAGSQSLRHLEELYNAARKPYDCSMKSIDRIAHLQSQLDECRKERDEAKAQRDANAESMRFIKEQRDQPIWEYSRNAWSRVMSMFVGAVGKDATDHVCDSITTLRTALAASQAQVGELQKDKERLESMRSSGF